MPFGMDASQLMNLIRQPANRLGQGIGNLGAWLGNWGQEQEMRGLIGDAAGTRTGDIDRWNQQMAHGIGQYGAQAQQGWGDLTTGLISSYGRERAGVQQGWGDLASTMGQGYADRYTKGMGMIEGAGAQQRKDIEQDYANRGAGISQDMVSRGLTGTTIMPSLQTGLEREKQASLGGLEESLLQQRVGTHGWLSGEQLGSQQALGTMGMQSQEGWGQGYQGLLSQLGTTGFNLGQQTNQQLLGQLGGYHQALGGGNQQYYNQMLQMLGGIEHAYPDQGLYAQSMQGLGYGAGPYAQAPSATSPWMSFGVPAAAGAGGAAAGTFIAQKAATAGMTCVDGHAPVMTIKGHKPLASIVVGDEVMTTPSRTFRKVVATDYGTNESQEFLRITTEQDSEIIVTAIHHINGKAAEDYKVGDRIVGATQTLQIKSILPTVPIPCGDLDFGEPCTYFANGFPVDSMFPLQREANRKATQ